MFSDLLSFALYGAMECSPGYSLGLPGRNPGNQNPINIEPPRGDGMAISLSDPPPASRVKISASSQAPGTAALHPGLHSFVPSGTCGRILATDPLNTYGSLPASAILYAILHK